MSRELRTVGQIAPTEVALFAHATSLETLEEVLHVRRWTVAEVVVQDEYTHDVIVATPGPYLVFDTT